MVHSPTQWLNGLLDNQVTNSAKQSKGLPNTTAAEVRNHDQT
jgi:hypothetical protein